MNIKLIAVAVAAFVAGHDIAITLANRRAEKMQADLDINERADIALRWYHIGGTIALSDKNAVKEAYDTHFPSTPAHTDN